MRILVIMSLMKTNKFVILTEDISDFNTLKVLVRRILEKISVMNPTIKPKYPTLGGCSHLRNKAKKWIEMESANGFNIAILVHDLDRDKTRNTLLDESRLFETLEAIKIPSKVTRHICIPVEELEAWFFADDNLLKKKLGVTKVQRCLNPHLIDCPKEKLKQLFYKAGQIHTTKKNENLADELDIELCSKRCPAFRNLVKFLHELYQ